MNERRIARLQEFLKERIAEVLSRDINDPDLGMVTVTRVKVDRELSSAKVFWSVLGDEKVRTKNEAALARAANYVRRAIAPTLHTRTMPRVKFLYDDELEEALRVESILDELRGESPEGTTEPADEPNDGDS